MPARASIQVTGLRELQAGLRQLDTDLPKGIRIALNQATQIIIDDAAPRVPMRSGRARASIRARSTQRAARIVAGGRRAPYYPWLDFGGKVGPGRSVERRFIADGRYIYDAYYRKRDSGEFVGVMKVTLAELCRRAGLQVSE